MPTSATASVIFRDILGDPEMRRIWSDENRTQRYLDFEAALARAQASIGMISKQAAAEIVAQGKAEIGFQEVAEILPVEGATFVGRIPDHLEYLTRFSAVVDSRSRNHALAMRLIEYLASPTALPVLEKMGLEPHRK